MTFYYGGAEPTRSFDIGMYLAVVGSCIGDSEYQRVFELNENLNSVTVSQGFLYYHADYASHLNEIGAYD